MRLRDELGVFYNDEEFAELYPERGQERDRTLAINDDPDNAVSGKSFRSANSRCSQGKN